VYLELNVGSVVERFTVDLIYRHFLLRRRNAEEIVEVEENVVEAEVEEIVVIITHVDNS
tara:strand:+ start:38 stop:214 length:177 start_codon:yes stop_codon:yes gene_type:complete